jgi:hypothetical protein
MAGLDSLYVYRPSSIDPEVLQLGTGHRPLFLHANREVAEHDPVTLAWGAKALRWYLARIDGGLSISLAGEFRPRVVS